MEVHPPRGKRMEVPSLRRHAIQFYKKFPKLFASVENEELASEVERLKKSNAALKDENKGLRDVKEQIEVEMMFACWDEHAPHCLSASIGIFNRVETGGLVCSCQTCVLETGRSDELPVLNSNCFLFERLRNLMDYHDITYAIEDPFENVRPGFHPNLACHYFHTVSDLDVHLVFPDPYYNPYRVYFGRKLWEVNNCFDDPDIERLKRFQKRLEFKALVVPQVPDLSSTTSCEP